MECPSTVLAELMYYWLKYVILEEQLATYDVKWCDKLTWGQT